MSIGGPSFRRGVPLLLFCTQLDDRFGNPPRPCLFLTAAEAKSPAGRRRPSGEGTIAPSVTAAAAAPNVSGVPVGWPAVKKGDEIDALLPSPLGWRLTT